MNIKRNNTSYCAICNLFFFNMCINFEGSIDDISERQLAFIEEVIVNGGFNKAKVTIEPVGVNGDNYMANVKRITVNDDNGVIKMIAKVATQNEIKRQLTKTHEIFKNEHVMYTEILPKFQELRAKANVPDEDRLRFAACYGSSIDAPHEIILLEDLQTSNFIMLDRLKPISNECIKSVLKNLAILHSLSHVLKSKEPQTFKEMNDKLFKIWALFDNVQFIAHMSQLEKQTEIIIEGEERKTVFNGAITKAIKIAKSKGAHSRYSVIQHGDSWTNNIMFKFDDDKLQESVMIDYQLSKTNSPAYDLQYLLFNCTDHKTRLEHYHDWIDYYHYEFDKSLSNFGLSANYIYPRDQLDADMKRHGKLMFGLSVLLASLSTTKSEDTVKLKQLFETKMNIDDIPQLLGFQYLDQNHLAMYKIRVEDLIDSYLEFGLLDNNHI